MLNNLKNFGTALALSLLASGIAHADLFGNSIEEGKGASQASGSAGPNGATGAAPSLEKCDKPLGKLALAEPQDFVTQSLSQYGLPSPKGLIRIIVQQSGCFVVVERGVAFQNIQQERMLAEGGQLRSGSNMGKGQLVTADYVMTPEVVFKNNNAGGAGALLGGLLGPVGAIVGGSMKFKEAQTTLTVADTRSGVQVAAASGSASKTDFGLGGLVGGGGVGLGLGAYENTAEGKVVAVAFLDAYNNVVRSIRGSAEMLRSDKTTKEETAVVAQSMQAPPPAATSGAPAAKSDDKFNDGEVLTPKLAGIPVYDKPNPKGKVIAKLGKGDEVITNGKENGEFIQVQNAAGEGWAKKSFLKRSGN